VIIFGDEYTTDEHCRTKLTDDFRTDGIWISTSNRFSYPFSPLDGVMISELTVFGSQQAIGSHILFHHWMEPCRELNLTVSPPLLALSTGKNRQLGFLPPSIRI